MCRKLLVSLLVSLLSLSLSDVFAVSFSLWCLCCLFLSLGLERFACLRWRGRDELTGKRHSFDTSPCQGGDERDLKQRERQEVHLDECGVEVACCCMSALVLV